jgi:glycerophosphoryl diester phosphodiesterase
MATSCKKENGGTSYPTLHGQRPLVIGHRGASGSLPEHTLEAYTLAIEQGADFIEPDVVLTKDSVLVCRHEPMLSGTTNVADLPAFASRKTTRTVDGVAYNDWFACDFTHSEIKMLKAKQAFSDRSQQYNGMYSIPTLQEVIELAKSQSASRGRSIGIYPETKHPSFHEQLKLRITDKLVDLLTAAGWNSAEAPVFVQSFEVSNLQYIRNGRGSRLKLVQLFDAYDVKKDGTMDMTAPNGQPYDFVLAGDPRTYNDLASDAGLAFIKTYADGIGPWKPFIQPYTFTDANNDGTADDINADGTVDNRDFTELPATTLLERAHAKGLLVHAYTFRDEPKRLLKDYGGDPKKEYQRYFDLGLDGVFSDFPSTAVAARK